MPDRKKSAQGNKRMNKAATAKRAEEPLLGEAALKEALAGFGVLPNAAGGFGPAPGASPPNGHAAADAAPAQAEPPPKTVSQILGEITWLMTQSPRHKAIPLGDLE
jgi:cytolysin-activating lysine-acyltransferase